MNKIGSLLFVLGMFATVGCAASTEEPAPSSDEAKTPEEAAAKEAKAPPAVQLDNVASQAAPAPKLPPSCVCLVNADGTPTDICYCY